MNEIEFKLTSRNPILIAHGISRISQLIKKKIEDNADNDTSKIPELITLYEKCKSEDPVVSSTACQAIVSLVKNKLLNLSPTLTQLIASLGETKNYSAVTAAIWNLLELELKSKDPTDNYLCPFSIKAPQHPLITVLIQKIDAWRDILSQMQSLLHCNDSELIKDYVELLRPVFMYILCNPSMILPESCRQETWRLLLKTHGTTKLQMEVLQWLKFNDMNSCINTSNIVLQLANVTIAEKNYELCAALTPLIMSLALDLLKHNADPRPNINMIETILNFIDYDFFDNIIGNILVSLLAEILTITPTFCLSNIMKIGMLIVTKLRCNYVIAHSLLASILPWMAYVTLMTADTLEIGEKLINTITTYSHQHNDNSAYFHNNRNQYIDILCYANQHYDFYMKFCESFDKISEKNIISWIERLSGIPKNCLFNYRFILCGIFLVEHSLNIIKITGKLLVQIIQNYNNFAGYVLSSLLYKLTKTDEIETTNELLMIIPELAVSKENVPIIVHTLETFLNAGAPLKYLAVNLYLKAWYVEPRCHRHLLTALIDMNKNDKTLKGNVTCAKAMKFICEHRPEHGAELVPLLSYILNHCTDIAGSAACAMALNGISALCLSGIADVTSTWKVLSPKMNKEERPIVIKSICEFFGDIPSNQIHSEDEFDNLIVEVLTKLWKFACFETTRNIEIVEAAYKALAAYPIKKMTLSILPEQFKTHIKLLETTENIAEELTYIPGSCWINILENIYEPARSIFSDFLIKLINNELYYFRTGIYTWSLGEPINYKYLPDKSVSRAIGEYLRRYKPSSTPDQQKIALECLKIFANKYSKALPPVKWNVLNDVLKMSDEAWDYGITIACHQAIVSPTAKEFLSKYITEITTQNDEMTEEKFKKYWHLCMHMEDICRGLMSNVLGPFLDLTINYIVDNAIVGKENFIIMFDQLMIQYSKSLSDDLVHHDNKTLITDILEKLLKRINVNNKIFTSLVKTMLEMSTGLIERITLPSVWPEITNELLEKAIIIRAGLVLKKDNEMPLSWMNEIIRASSLMPEVHACLYENMAKIQIQLRNEKSNATWCWNLMCRIQTTLVDSNEINSIHTAEFFCDILFITVIILSCVNCSVENDEMIVLLGPVREQLFPHALASIVSTSHWKNTTQQIMEWLHFMRTSSLHYSYKLAFHNALVSLKHERYLNDSWTKYFSIQGPLNL